MRRTLLICVIIVLLCACRAAAQDGGYTERAKKYIDKYATLAILEQQKYGIPASITLGQGILETEAGASELMTEANNHFGIKCKNGWQGPTYTHTDDAPNECFKKYSCAAESYSDHSALLLRNPRYAPLLKVPATDYAGWAKCLKKCGYATNPQYAERLIKIIEDFKLQDYTFSALDSSLMSKQSIGALTPANSGALSDTAAKPLIPHSALVTGTNAAKNAVSNVVAPAVTKTVAYQDTVKRVMQPAVPPKPSKAQVAMADSADFPADKATLRAEGKIAESKVVMVNGLKAFYAFKDELLLQYAMKYKVSYQQLLAINDLADGPLPYNMYIYLERKLTKGYNNEHVMRDGETMLMAAQAEGMQLKSLRELNLMNPNEEPVEGTVLELQVAAHVKPQVTIGPAAAHTRNAIVMGEDKAGQPADFIALGKTRSVTYADTARPHVSQVNKPVVIDDVAGMAEVVAAPVQDAGVPALKKQPAAAPVTGKMYTVKKGDTAFSIAKNNNATLEQLMKWNDMDSPGLKVGQVIRVKE